MMASPYSRLVVSFCNENLHIRPKTSISFSQEHQEAKVYNLEKR